MWGRELRAGLAFVLVSLLVGAGVREWRRNHEVRFQELVDALVEQDEAIAERGVSRSTSDTSAVQDSTPGSTFVPAMAGDRRGGRTRAKGVPLHAGALDVDRASVSDWIRLPGIGPSLAARIAADRAARGPFAGPEGLLRVPGIGPKTLEKIRPFLAGHPSVTTADSIRSSPAPATSAP